MSEDLFPAPKGVASGRYADGFSEREPYLERARGLSGLTVPSLFRQMGANGATSDVTPWQSLGGYGVNNLAAKLVLAMFPPGISPINIKQDKKSLDDLKDLPADVRGDLKAQIDKALSKEEVMFVECTEEDGDRAVHFDVARHLIVGGNHCLHVCDDGMLQGFPLEEYVCWRDRRGTVQEFVIDSPMAYNTMPADVQAICRANGYGPTENAEGDHKGDVNRPGSNWECEDPIWEPISVFTHGRLRDGLWDIYDEVMSVEVPGSRHPYKPEVMPYLFLRMVALKNEHYGRSYCEDYEGDLQTYDAIWQALTEGGAVLARVITLIKAGGTLNKDAYSKAGNGAILTGDKEEIAVVSADKGGDIEIILKQSEKIESRLERIFILNSAVERSGERVTATEISFKAQELDTTLGGVYSNQVTTWQKPWAELKIAAYMKQGRMTKLPKGSTKITILTGDAALGRMQKAQTLEEFLQVMAQILTPPVMGPWLRVGNAMERSAANRSIDTDGLIKSKDEVDADQQKAQQAAMAQQVAPQVVAQGGQMMQNAQQGAIDQQQQQQQTPPDVGGGDDQPSGGPQ